MNKCLFILFVLLPVAANANLTCHLHPPSNQKSKDSSSLLRGEYKNQQHCEKENASVYGMKGRCHCLFSNDVMPFLGKPVF